MSAPTVVRPAIAPLDLDGALATYRQHCADMTDQQLTEERHRLEAQPPYGEAHRIANEVFEERNPVARLEHITAGGSRCGCPAWHPDNDHTEAEHTSCSGYHRCGGCDDCVSAIAINSTGGAS